VQVAEHGMADADQVHAGGVEPGQPDQRQAGVQLLAGVEAADGRRRAARQVP
jgi:hypothetical protein